MERNKPQIADSLGSFVRVCSTVKLLTKGGTMAPIKRGASASSESPAKKAKPSDAKPANDFFAKRAAPSPAKKIAVAAVGTAAKDKPAKPEKAEKARKVEAKGKGKAKVIDDEEEEPEEEHATGHKAEEDEEEEEDSDDEDAEELCVYAAPAPTALLIVSIPRQRRDLYSQNRQSFGYP